MVQVGRGRLEAVVLVSGLVLLVHWCLVGLLFPCLATPGTRTRVVALVHAFTLAVMVWEVRGRWGGAPGAGVLCGGAPPPGLLPGHPHLQPGQVGLPL